MGFLTTILGNRVDGGNGSGVTHTGGHALSKDRFLAQTSADAINPMSPGRLENIKSMPTIPGPRYATAEEAQALKELAAEKRQGLTHARRFYRAAETIEACDAKLQKLHRRYEGKVADAELSKVRSNARLGRHLHALRPHYARLGLGFDAAENRADSLIQAAEQRYLQAMNR